MIHPPEVKAAMCFARLAHRGQLYGTHPYYNAHVLTVWNLVKEHEPNTQIIALLHDVCEDTDVTFDEIEALFGLHIRYALVLLTDPPGDYPTRLRTGQLNRKARKEGSNQALTTCHNYPALAVKAADRLVNVRESVSTKNESLLCMYRREHPAFRAACFRAGHVPEIWTALDLLIGNT